MVLKTNTMYILSGVPGSGKSTFLSRNVKEGNIAKNMIVSSDKLRKKILGKKYSLINDELVEDLSSHADETVFNIIEKTLNEKCKEHLTCFVDATNTTEIDRARWARIAKKHNMSAEVLIFDESIETCIERNAKRDRQVPEETIQRFSEKLERKSLLPYHTITSDELIQFTPKNQINGEKLDIIGDVHGLYTEMIAFIKELGYTIQEDVATHPDGRKLLFLGDLVDRGPDSIKVLKFLYKNVKAGHYSIQGNHEVKLINNFYKKEKGLAPTGSVAVLKTFIEFLKEIPEKLHKSYIKFLEELPVYYIIDGKHVCVHANVMEFNPLTTLRTDMLYGSTRVYQKVNADTDKAYQKLFDKGINKYSLIRGHVPQTSKQKNVLSLEEEQCFEGYLACLRLDLGITQRYKTEFNYEKVKKETLLLRKMNKLEKEGLVSYSEDDTNLLRIYKYSKQVFFKNLWSKDQALLRARGLVLDVEGNIVQNPFTKVFNYGENGTGLDMKDKREVIAVEKLNGFLGCISKHPFKQDLLITTTGSFSSDFVGYIKDFVDAKVKGNLLKYFALHGNKTLMFEVIHPNDPHIISYNEKDQGLWLIGARELNSDSVELKEAELDSIASILSFRRPQHFRTTLGELKEIVRNSSLEGYMVRDTADEKTLLKFKTPYYLTTKFLGRMGESNIKFMFGNPYKFKEKVDEEFYPIVDAVVKNVELNKFLEMENTERVSFVRELINDLRG